jgi:hypothetical protein
MDPYPIFQESKYNWNKIIETIVCDDKDDDDKNNSHMQTILDIFYVTLRKNIMEKVWFFIRRSQSYENN